jgi:hypothetical protein
MKLRGMHQSNGAGPAAPSQVRPHYNRPQLARAGHTWPGLGSAAPTGAPVPLCALAPIICHILGPRHQQSHEQVLDGWETMILCRLDQKAKVGSTWIDGPTLNHRNCHQGVILDVTPHYRCITWWFGRCARTYRAGRTYQLACWAKPTQGADLQPPQQQWLGSSKSIGSGS